jgi:hypothetical protein
MEGAMARIKARYGIDASHMETGAALFVTFPSRHCSRRHRLAKAVAVRRWCATAATVAHLNANADQILVARCSERTPFGTINRYRSERCMRRHPIRERMLTSC